APGKPEHTLRGNGDAAAQDPPARGEGLRAGHVRRRVQGHRPPPAHLRPLRGGEPQLLRPGRVVLRGPLLLREERPLRRERARPLREGRPPR
ncbi:MAG: hypothetical protein AVDCRST_MAG12-1807, partial [uncultured Rubrobacteraceae bacterium]